MTFKFPNESDAYRAQRNALLEQEVALRAQTEAVAAARRQLPLGGRLAKDYVFLTQTDSGVSEVAFEALFGEHEHLLLYSMMFGAEWDAPCPSCTSIVDGISSAARGVQEAAAVAVVAGARPEQLQVWGQRRGWLHFPLVSGAENTYLLDYAGFETDDPGKVSAMNVFTRNADGIFHRWSSELVGRPMDNGHPRHVDPIWPLWNLLDLNPGGRGDILVPRQDFAHNYFTKHILGGE